MNKKSVYTSFYTDDDGNRSKLFEIKKTNQTKDLCSKDKKIPTCLPIDVYMGWISEEGKYITEYLPTKELMIDTMRQAGCQLVDTDLFSNVYYMNKEYFEKGIPKPEASARRLDVRNYDSREAWGWLSEDERLIMSKEGVTYVDVELVCLKFDEFLKEYKLSIHQIDGKRLLRWMRHIRDHQGEWDMDDIDLLE